MEASTLTGKVRIIGGATGDSGYIKQRKLGSRRRRACGALKNQKKMNFSFSCNKKTSRTLIPEPSEAVRVNVYTRNGTLAVGDPV